MKLAHAALPTPEWSADGAGLDPDRALVFREGSLSMAILGHFRNSFIRAALHFKPLGSSS